MNTDRRSTDRMSTDSTPRQTGREGRPRKSFMRFLPAIVRVLLGAPLALFGGLALLGLMPEPTTPLPEDAMAFVDALVDSGYMMQLIAVTQLVVGVLLLVNRFVPLALALFAPFLVNSIAFHIFLEPSGLPMVLVFLAVVLYLVWTYRDAYRPMLRARHEIGG